MSSPRRRGPVTPELPDQIGSIAPVRILAFDKPNFPVAIPFFQLLLAADGFFGRLILFKMHEAMNFVFPDELRAVPGAMQVQYAKEIVDTNEGPREKRDAAFRGLIDAMRTDLRD